jgi:hypothetical protein
VTFLIVAVVLGLLIFSLLLVAIEPLRYWCCYCGCDIHVRDDREYQVHLAGHLRVDLGRYPC